MNLKITILREGDDGRGNIITPDACKSLVERFNKTPEKMFIKLGGTPIKFGTVNSLQHDEEKREVVGEVDLHLDFSIGGRVVSDIQLPHGRSIVDCELKGIIATLTGGTFQNGQASDDSKNNKDSGGV